jgi:hypothetical protein
MKSDTEILKGMVTRHIVRAPARFRYVKTERPNTTPEIEAEIERIWGEKSGRKYSDPLVGVNYISSKDENTEIGWYDTEYKRLFATRLDQIPGYHEEILCVSGLARVHWEGERYLMFGERSSKEVNKGGSLEILPQGFNSPEDMDKEDPLVLTALKEYEEELYGVPALNNYIDPRFLSLTVSTPGYAMQAGMLLDVHPSPEFVDSLEESSREKIVLKTNPEGEHTERFGINTKHAWDFAMRKHESITPISNFWLDVLAREGIIS